ncbi:hypothetical protein GOL81_21250 [Sinorhizobium medicae]|nr:hypothetical protein [Sinorhizobium medicae]
MNFFKCVLALSGAFLLLSGAAQARDWGTETKEDVFTGKQTAVMIAGLSKPMSLYFSCDADHQVRLAVIFKVNEVAEDVPATLVMKVDNGEAVKFDVTSYQHNDEYGGFHTVSGNILVADLVKSVGQAKSRLLVGLDIPLTGVKDSDEFSIRGSTAAANEFIKAREIK